MAGQQRLAIAVDEYLAQERQSATKGEYYQGNDYSVEQFVRKDSDQWLFTEIKGLAETVQLNSIQSALALREIYDKVED